jgi:hypothetical protein
MLRVVLPPVALPSLAPVNVSVRVSVEIVVVVDVYVAAVVPVTIAPIATGPSTKRESRCAPRQPHSGVVSRIAIRVIRVLNRSSSVNDRRVVGRNINYVWLSRLNYDRLPAALDRFGLHYLLRSGF